MSRQIDMGVRRVCVRAHGIFLLVLLLASLSGGCERARSLFGAGAEDESGGEPVEAVDFVVDSDGVFYATLLGNGELIGADRLARVPVAERAAVVVHVRGETEELEERHYVADLVEARPGDEVTARLRRPEQIRATLIVAEKAALGALGVRNKARVMLDVHGDKGDESGAVVVRRASKRPSSAKAASAPKEQVDSEDVLDRENRLQMEKREAIELFAGADTSIASDTVDRAGDDDKGIVIRRVNGAESATPTASATGGYGWKPITLYYADWCGYCTKARRWLDANDVPHRAVNIDASEKNAREMDRFCRSKNVSDSSIPTFRIGDQVMQGWSPERFEELARR